MNRRLLITVFTVLALVVALPALAERGGNGKGKGNGNGNGTTTTSTAWVSASPNLADPGETVWVNGCGYDIYNAVELRVVRADGYTQAWGVGVWYTGCMNPTPITMSETGTYTIEVHQKSSPNLQLKASTTLEVR